MAVQQPLRGNPHSRVTRPFSRSDDTRPNRKTPVSGCSVLSTMPLLLLLLNAVSAFKLCPSHCLCYTSSGLVDCQSRGLVQVPPNVPHGARLLDLSENELTEVGTGSFVGLWSLKILLMSNNSIQTLQPQCLSSLQFLERLDLSLNQLPRLPQHFSRGLSSLQELRLDHNLLQHLDSSSLSDFENLRKLDLSYNRIQAMDVGAFGSLSRLILLKLEGNRLNVLKDGVLRRLQSLEVLLLDHNNISVIETEALAPLRSLTLLSLQSNQLQRVTFKSFLKLHTTTTTTLLRMSSNPWTCDCDLQRVFGKIKRVRHLHVYDYQDITCHAPAHQAGSSLASLDGQLCLCETASVLVITLTVMLAVIGVLVKAEHNQKNKRNARESDRQDK